MTERMSASEHFELVAEHFYRATGMLAPGKSEAPEFHADPEERRRLWEVFQAGRDSAFAVPRLGSPPAAGEREVAVVLHEDRHSDASVFLFSDPETAVRFAKARIREFDRWDALDEELTEPMRRAGWLYSGTIEDCGSIRVEVLSVAAPTGPAAGAEGGDNGE